MINKNDNEESKYSKYSNFEIGINISYINYNISSKLIKKLKKYAYVSDLDEKYIRDLDNTGMIIDIIYNDYNKVNNVSIIGYEQSIDWFSDDTYKENKISSEEFIDIYLEDIKEYIAENKKS